MYIYPYIHTYIYWRHCQECMAGGLLTRPYLSCLVHLSDSNIQDTSLSEHPANNYNSRLIPT